MTKFGFSQDDVGFVTAFSEDYKDEGFRMISFMHQFFPNHTLTIFDLGLRSKTKKKIGKFCNVNLRPFNFGEYPKKVRELKEYRWKPIIIAQALRDHPAIWYFDSSVVLNSSHLDHVYDLIRCRQNSDYRSFSKIPLIPERDRRENKTKLENGWDKNRWTKNVEDCQKSGYLLHGFSGHGIFGATHPDIYKYFPTDIHEIKKFKAKMYEAGLAFVAKTEDAVDVLKWYVLCALDENCMAPHGSQRHCYFGIDSYGKYWDCHRYDQSVINVLLANANYFDRTYYVSEIVDFFKIKRGGAEKFYPPKYDFNCTS